MSLAAFFFVAEWGGVGAISQRVEADSEIDPIVKALHVLQAVPSGKNLVNQALRNWHASQIRDLKEEFKLASVSRTDAVLIRHYNPLTGEERRERKVLIYLRENQPFFDLVLDMAHELVHATSRPSFDPYDPKLTAGIYVRSAIEGEGGEVDAVSTECQISMELRNANLGNSDRCAHYFSPLHQLDREKITRDFYRVGSWQTELGKRLGEERKLFPLMSKNAPRLYSSTGRSPYPVALLNEFDELTQIACENSYRRARQEKNRSPASLNSGDSRSPETHFLNKRCLLHAVIK